MRVPTSLAALILSVPLIAAGPAPATNKDCPRTTSYLADQSSAFKGKPLTPKKLTELPPAQGYMAVLRRIGGCEVPLTMIEYKNPRRR